jgi:restriction endonuclease S subunit
MEQLLQHISYITPGVHVSDSANGDGYLLQPRHFGGQGQKSEEQIPRIYITARLNKYLLQPGDILLTAKGREHFAALYTGSPAPAVHASAFMSIRLRNHLQVLPAYLCWYLNHPNTQKALSASAKGTAMPALTMGDVADIRIYIPPVLFQEQIVKLSELQQRKEQLSQKLENLERQQIQQQLLTIAKHSS